MFFSAAELYVQHLGIMKYQICFNYSFLNSFTGTSVAFDFASCASFKYCLINERLVSLLNVFKNDRDVQCRSNHSNYLKQISTCIVLLIFLKF